jgi:hypothetical protein
MLAKCDGLILIIIYAFFKFAWSYRLFNCVAILLGVMPPASGRYTAKAETHVIRTTRLFEAAGRHFNRGQRAFFFALGYLGWFVSPLVLLVTTALVFIVRVERVAGDGELTRRCRRKILRREAEIEHLPFAVTVRRQHRIGLTGLQRADRALHQQWPLHRSAGLDQDRIRGQPAVRRHLHTKLDPDVVARRQRGRQLRAGPEMTPKFRNHRARYIGRLGRRPVEGIIAPAAGLRGWRRHRRDIRRQAEQHLILDRDIRLGLLVGRGCRL